MGAVDEPRLQPTFKATSREQEGKRRLPDNGPSPSSHQFNPSYRLVHQKLATTFQSTQARFPNDLQQNFEVKKKLQNPRFDRHEGIHSLVGKNPDCSTCHKRIQQTEKQWMIKPLVNSMYGKRMNLSLVGKSRQSRSHLKRKKYAHQEPSSPDLRDASLDNCKSIEGGRNRHGFHTGL